MIVDVRQVNKIWKGRKAPTTNAVRFEGIPKRIDVALPTCVNICVGKKVDAILGTHRDVAESPLRYARSRRHRIRKTVGPFAIVNTDFLG